MRLDPDELLDALVVRMPIARRVIAAARHEHATGGGLLASGVAYRLYMWLIPIGFAAAAAGSALGIDPEQDLETAAGKRGIGAVIVTAERQALDASNAEPWMQVAVALAVAIWLGHGVVRALYAVYAIAWELPIPKIRRRVRAGLAFTGIAALLLGVSSRLGELIAAAGLPSIVLLASKIVIYGAVAFSIALVLPRREVRWQQLLPGAGLVAAGAAGMHVAVDLYIGPRLADSASTYGMLGAATVILLWLYLIARLMSISAFLNAALAAEDRASGAGS